MFDKVLIANRGEIACRVIRTCKRLGVRTVAVYSEADADAMHVAMADEAYHIGGAAAADSYLRGNAIIEVAEQSGALAIHPGYGFLSENAGFARTCADVGLIFVGPPAKAIEAMGSKSAAKAIMEAAKVPLVPGYHGEDQDDAILAEAAERIGYPVLLKASAGGGGKGMRVVERASAFADALASARRESKAAFGDSHMLVEKYLTRPRHVEVQVFADTHGGCVHLFERDCSIQRRHQKVIEEAPAPGMTPELRRKMGEAAVNAAKAIGYVGAGTVEFLLDEDGSFYFMEMNTRLQVEHPVTEMITGQDLVEWQLRVAEGGHLPLSQDELGVDGHSMEARIYAEDPDRNFLPATGTLRRLRFPVEEPHVRVETGVREGDEVSIYYDPMIAKLVVWGEDRNAAVRLLRQALGEVKIAGLSTNVDFLASVAGHPAFMEGDVTTRFIEQHQAELLPEKGKASARVLALAALHVLVKRGDEARQAAAASADPHSPWAQTDGWRLNDDNHHELYFIDDGEEVCVTVHYRGDGYLLEVPQGEGRAAAELRAAGETDHNGDLLADVDGVRIKAVVSQHADELTIILHGSSHRLAVFDPAMRAAGQEAGTGRLTAPMPGKVVAVMVKEGQKVEQGVQLLVLEAMKMEHTITAPADGTVAAIHFAAGDQVDDGAELLSFEVVEE
ncbi:MAG: acetyl/propionyl/methylcrotonyl-CoA carboxylase subunit alpha [Rhodospirillales bacterium]|nr:acetyl/propionyl/methylcrotonyl-CoA carboxylase subunit alpha [Rhodospirillales bacterium]MCW9001894.1 acetyl/propionyl/methylcrotonyl-CoA carboxylase subunit alpha [Rhodospirillales bacterium]